MASKPISIVAVLHPKPGKVDQAIALMSEVADYARENEPGTLQYEVTRSLKPAKDGTEEIVMIEKYKDAEALKIHGGSAPFKAMQKKMAEQKLMRAPPIMKTVSEKGGYASRL